MINIVLVEPEIPQNTGNIARTCACAGMRLHLVEPLGFQLSHKQLSRAGCDYWDEVDLIHWNSAETFFRQHENDDLHLFTGKVSRSFAEVSYADEAYLVFGRESRGLDEQLLTRYCARCVRIPMRPQLRSLNISNAVAIASYEVLRQHHYPCLV